MEQRQLTTAEAFGPDAQFTREAQRVPIDKGQKRTFIAPRLSADSTGPVLYVVDPLVGPCS